MRYPQRPEEGVIAGWLWAALWALGTEPWSSGRATSALNHWAISPAPWTCSWIHFNLYFLIILFTLCLQIQWYKGYIQYFSIFGTLLYFCESLFFNYISAFFLLLWMCLCADAEIYCLQIFLTHDNFILPPSYWLWASYWNITHTERCTCYKLHKFLQNSSPLWPGPPHQGRSLTGSQNSCLCDGLWSNSQIVLPDLIFI